MLLLKLLTNNTLKKNGEVIAQAERKFLGTTNVVKLYQRLARDYIFLRRQGYLVARVWF
jgi:hypothetical protein